MRIRHVILAAAGILAGGCALFTPETAVSVRIPTPPGHWLHAFPDMRFRLEYWDASGSRQELEVSQWWLPVTISCAKAMNSPILAYPLTSWDGGAYGPGSLRPSGGLYPGSLAQGEAVRLSWQDGPLAALFARIRAAGLDISLLNAARLGERLNREQDPWNLDLNGMAEELAGGGFTTYDVDLLPCRDACIAAGAGAWFLESPFQDWQTAEAGVVTLKGVNDGTHGLYSAEGRFILIQVSGEGIVTMPQCP